MKRISVVCVLVLALAVGPALAIQKNTSITCNPLGMAIGLFNAEANFAVKSKVSMNTRVRPAVQQ